MNRHVGASFTLSVLIVVFFAVALYRPDPPRSPAPASTESRVPGKSPGSTASRVPEATPGVPLTEAKASSRGELASDPSLSLMYAGVGRKIRRQCCGTFSDPVGW